MKYSAEILEKLKSMDVAISVKTRREWKLLTAFLEKETDLKWSEGELPTEFEEWGHHEEDSCILVIKEDLLFGDRNYVEEENFKVVDLEVLLDFKEERILNPSYDQLKPLFEKGLD